MQSQMQTGRNRAIHGKSMPNGLKLLLLASPFVLFIIAFSYVPLMGWAYAFYDYIPGIPWSKTPFIGLEKFIAIFKDSSDLLRVLRNTLVMSFLSIFSSPLPVVFAILLNEVRNTHFKKLVQTTTTLPHFVSWIIVFSLTFSLFSDGGMVNTLLTKLKIPMPPAGILGDNDSVWTFQWLLGLWKNLGWNAIIYLAAIVGIDSELYDAAKVDGANRFQTIMNVTVPGLYSTYLVLLLLAISNLLQNGFDQYFVFYNPLVADRIEVLDYFVYKVGIVINDYPLSVALGMTKTLVSVLLLFSANSVSRKLRGESII